MNKRPTKTLAEACDAIARGENLNESTEHYLKHYDIALHAIFGTELYKGAGLCAQAAWTINAKLLRKKNEELRNKGK